MVACAQTATERFAAGVERLTEAPKDGRPGGVLNATGPVRRAIAAAGRPAGAVAGGAATLRRTAGKVNLRNCIQSGFPDLPSWYVLTVTTFQLRDTHWRGGRQVHIIGYADFNTVVCRCEMFSGKEKC